MNQLSFMRKSLYGTQMVESILAFKKIFSYSLGMALA